MKCCKRKRGLVLFQILSAIIVLVTVERMVFDTFGQMWGPLLINCMTALCSLTGMVGVCIREKIAIGVYSVWNVISIGLNFVVIFIYNDIGLLRQKEHYLGLSVGNDNWWRTHGIGCEGSGDTEGSGAGGNDTTTECIVSYATIETIHGAVYIALAVLTLLLSVCLLCARKKDNIPGDDESFNFVSVSRYQDYTRPQRHCRKWSYSTYDTSISLWCV